MAREVSSLVTTVSTARDATQLLEAAAPLARASVDLARLAAQRADTIGMWGAGDVATL